MIAKLPSSIWLAPIALLIVAIIPLPYIYYILLRFITCGVAGYLAYIHYKEFGVASWVVVLGMLALLFNPLLPFYAAREIWMVFDIIAAAILGAHFISYRKDAK